MTEADALREENEHLQNRLAALEAVIQENQNLQARIEELEARSRTAEPPSTGAPSTDSTHPALKDVKIDLPPEFDGKTAEYAAFIGHCEFYFDNKPSIFHDNPKNKVSLVISRLRGRAATWAHALRRADPDNPVFHSWPLFRAELDSLFEDTYYMEQMRHEYSALKQKGSARNFATEFKTLATILHKDEGTKIFDFKEKLKFEVQKGLAIATGLHNFDILVAKAIELDQTLFETAKAAKKAEQLQKSGTSSSSHSQQPHNKPRPSGHPHPSGHPRPSGSQSSTSSPPLTNEEKDRREKNGLCRVCGSPDHWKKNCPRHLAKLEHENKPPPRYSTPTSTSSVPPTATSTHVIFPPMAPALRRPGNPIPQDPSRQDA